MNAPTTPAATPAKTPAKTPAIQRILSDRFGRKRALLGFIALYGVGVAATTMAPSLGLMIAARFVRGLGGAGPRAVAIAMIRDSHEGVRMAQVLSYVQSIFVIVPVLAPTLGAVALHAGGWRGDIRHHRLASPRRFDSFAAIRDRPVPRRRARVHPAGPTGGVDG